MYKFFITAAMVLFSFSAAAQEKVSYLEEMKTLGIVAGQGLACNSAKYDQFEMLARAIMLTKAPSLQALQDGIYAYNSSKADVFLAKKRDGGYLCGEILQMFDNQDIFNITLYEDGTLKMPDGQIITPKTPYDATKIYAADSNLQQTVNDIYQKGANRARAAENQRPIQAPAMDYTPNRPLQVQNAPQDSVQPLDSYYAPEETIGHLSRR